jgi:hypothetical protein
MKTHITLKVAAVLGLVALSSSPGATQDWDTRREMREGAREISRERREARREIRDADSRVEARHEIREGAREVSRERREARNEVRRSTWY